MFGVLYVYCSEHSFSLEMLLESLMILRKFIGFKMDTEDGWMI